MKFEGIYTPAITPLTAQGQIDKTPFADVLDADRGRPDERVDGPRVLRDGLPCIEDQDDALPGYGPLYVCLGSRANTGSLEPEKIHVDSLDGTLPVRRGAIRSSR
ncbi:hypothetical protein [Paraburkholderia tuberum]|nr:hypothetical protein [Paraburkholderia tuberum]